MKKCKVDKYSGQMLASEIHKMVKFKLTSWAAYFFSIVAASINDAAVVVVVVDATDLAVDCTEQNSERWKKKIKNYHRICWHLFASLSSYDSCVLWCGVMMASSHIIPLESIPSEEGAKAQECMHLCLNINNTE